MSNVHGLYEHATEIDQVNFKHEIFSIEFNERDAIFKGYAFVIEQQHHHNQNTHEISLEIVNSKGESFIFSSKLLPSDYTTHMQYRSTLQCPVALYQQSNTTCFYDYQNVQFEASIPLNAFELNEVYTFNVIIHLKNTNKTFKTKIYSLLNQTNYESNNKIFTFDAYHFSNQLQIVHSEIVVRNAPTISGSVYFVGTNCSTTYRNQLFFQKDSVYTNIRTIQFNEFIGLTYYELEGMLSTCVNSRRTVVEGTTIKPIYINRFMVNLVGDPLTLHVSSQLKPKITMKLRFYNSLISDRSLYSYTQIINSYKK